MQGIQNAKVAVKRACPRDGKHYFFGYYDLQAFDSTGKFHLCHQTSFRNRLPEPDDRAVLGLADLNSGRFEPLAETSAFNFQQGALLQWHPTNGNEICYNIRQGSGFAGVVENLSSGRKRLVERAPACISADGKLGLGINFSRLFDFRPGYGYSGVADPYANEAAPKEDGIFRIDMETGESRLLISYAELAGLFGLEKNEKVVINHITFAPKGHRFMFLLRTFPRAGKSWGTLLGAMDADGGGFCKLSGRTMISHYHWRDEKTLLMYAELSSGRGLLLVDGETGENTRQPAQWIKSDIHCLYSPDRKYILGDGYPDTNGYRPLYWMKADTGEGGVLLEARSQMFMDGHNAVDSRCDLHARWNRTGTAISFDSTHESETGLYWAEIDGVL